MNQEQIELYVAGHMSEAEAFEYEAGYTGSIMASNDAKEGPRAFVEKRKAVFQGR